MLRGIDIGAAGCEILAKDQDGFPVRIVFTGGFWKADISRENRIPGDLLPEKVKRVSGVS
ncbi:MAG: hypothetical protein WA399_04230 [Acidobacteriaceae bacterium]